jgi:hypothetical protein
MYSATTELLRTSDEPTNSHFKALRGQIQIKAKLYSISAARSMRNDQPQSRDAI